MGRFFPTFLLLLTASVASAQMQMGMAMPSLKIEQTDGNLIFEVGPVELPAHADHHEIMQPPPFTTVFPVGGWFHGFTVDLVDAHGNPIPKELLHHVNVIAPGKRELFSGIMLRLGASGSETSPVLLPRMLGYRAEKGDSLLVSAMLHNPTDKSYTATLRIIAPYTSDHSYVGALGIYPFYMDVMPAAGSHSFDVPPGHSEHFWEAKPAIDGRILGVSGHVHKYGTELRLEDRTTSKLIWRATPTTDSTGEIVGMPIDKFFLTFGIPIYPDHVYRLTAVYENPTGAPIADGGMGALGGAFFPTNKSWPSIDRSSQDYLTDARLSYRVDDEMSHHHMP